MNLLVVSSLDALCRQQACEALAAARPGSTVVLHDLLENGRVVRRIFDGAGVIERGEATLEHGCLSCAVRLDLVPAIGRLLDQGHDDIIIGLPPAVPAATAVSALTRGLRHQVRVSSALLACAPDALEDHLWDAHTLFESGFTPVADDDRTPGEFLLGELAFADTVLLAEPDIVPADPVGRRRGLHLVREVAPHADVALSAAAVRPGRHRFHEAAARTAPGTVHGTGSPRNPASPFATVLAHVERPLHPGRFREALGTLAAGCCVLRGQLWVASAPDCRIALQGVGPRVWLENVGRWSEGRPGAGRAEPLTAATVLSATGENLDPAEFERLLRGCELTDEELAAGVDLPDPFGLPPSGHTSPTTHR
jgi:G3E family GTPase